MRLIIYFIIACLALALDSASAQQRRIIHKPKMIVPIPGLRREFTPELAHITLSANPGWRAEEIVDSTDGIYQLLFSDPQDSTKKILSLLIYPAKNSAMDSTSWAKTKRSVDESYGNRGIATRPLFEQISNKQRQDSTGILANYEVLTKHEDYLEYVDAIVGKRSLVLLTVPLKPAEYQKHINYFRDIAQSVKLEN